MCKGLGYCQHWEIHQQGRAWLSCSRAEVAPAGGPASSTVAAPAEEKEVEGTMGESEESEDNTGFLTTPLLLMCSVKSRKCKNKRNLGSSIAEGLAQLQSVYIEHARPRTKQNFIPEEKHKPTRLH